MKLQKINISFNGKPNNYKQIDEHLSRSAQPVYEDFVWLKTQGVTDIINFRTGFGGDAAFLSEKHIVEGLGMKYHQIASITARPQNNNIEKFLNLMQEILQNNRKAHIHCKAGADRTGMYAYVYESVHDIATQGARIKEWMTMGHHFQLFPDLIPWTVDYVNSFKTLKR